VLKYSLIFIFFIFLLIIVVIYLPIEDLIIYFIFSTYPILIDNIFVFLFLMILINFCVIIPFTSSIFDELLIDDPAYFRDL